MSDIDDLRRARRTFIRTHHPDRGGDPERFVAGLAQFDWPPPIRVVLRPRPTWRSRFAAVSRRLRPDPGVRRVR